MSHKPDEITKLIFKRKPKKCPVCGATRIAKISYGMPAPTEDLQKKLEEKKVVLGGCIISPDDPSWCCTECESVFFREGFKPRQTRKVASTGLYEPLRGHIIVCV